MKFTDIKLSIKQKEIENELLIQTNALFNFIWFFYINTINSNHSRIYSSSHYVHVVFCDELTFSRF